MIIETTDIPVYESPVPAKKKPEPEIDYYEKKKPRQKIAAPGAELLMHFTCCDEEVSLCSQDMRSIDGVEDSGQEAEGMCIVCVKLDESPYHTCPFCGRF